MYVCILTVHTQEHASGFSSINQYKMCNAALAGASWSKSIDSVTSEETKKEHEYRKFNEESHKSFCQFKRNYIH